MLLFLAASPRAVASDYPAAGTYEIDKSASELRVLVYPAGLLGGLGHSHVISTDDIGGRVEIREHPGYSRVQLTFPVASLEVDNERLRAEEGEDFEKSVSDRDRQGTRRNMLGRKVLDGSRFGTVTVRSNEWSGELPDVLVKAEFTVKDQINVVEFPVSVIMSDNSIVVTGTLMLTHRQLGLKPYKAALGSLRVRDEMVFKFRITARRQEY